MERPCLVPSLVPASEHTVHGCFRVGTVGVQPRPGPVASLASCLVHPEVSWTRDPQSSLDPPNCHSPLSSPLSHVP